MGGRRNAGWCKEKHSFGRHSFHLLIPDQNLEASDGVQEITPPNQSSC